MAVSMKITAIPSSDRPREKILSSGPESLTDSELLALLLGFGIKGTNVLELSQTILTQFGGIKGLSSMDKATLSRIRGIGKGKGCLLLALGEICKRCASLYSPDSIDGTLRYLQSSIGASEAAYVLVIDGKGRVMQSRLIGKGSSFQIELSVTEILRVAVSAGALRYVLVHFHTSGSPFPSSEDVKMTKSLMLSSNKVHITLLDHIILSSDGRFSFAENGML